MKAFLFLWNPKLDVASFAPYAALVSSVSVSDPYRTPWICRSTKPRPNDFAFMKRSGKDHPGIFARGIVTRSRYLRRKDGQPVVGLEIHSVLPFGKEIARTELRSQPFANYHWDTPASGNEIPQELLGSLDALWAIRTGSDTYGELHPAHDEPSQSKEGELRLVEHLLRERDPRLAREKKDASRTASGDLVCEACGLNPRLVYSASHRDVCEVHHRRALSNSATPVTTTLADLAILCPSCHRAIHQTTPLMEVEEFRKTIRQASSSPD